MVDSEEDADGHDLSWISVNTKDHKRRKIDDGSVSFKFQNRLDHSLRQCKVTVLLITAMPFKRVAVEEVPLYQVIMRWKWSQK